MKYKNELIVAFSLALAVFSLISNFYVINKIEDRQIRVTGKFASAGSNATLCLNNPPYINISACSSTFMLSIIDNVIASGNYSCTINVSDVETPTSSIIISDNTPFFNISSSGYIYFIPSRSNVGVKDYSILATDTSVCENRVKEKMLQISVSYANEAPKLIKEYPDSGKKLVLKQYYQTVSWSLDTFFYDPNGDELFYDNVYLDSHCFNIGLEIDNKTHIVTYTPGNFNTVDTGPCQAYFSVHDNFSGTNQTNVFNITVQKTEIEETDDIPPSAGGSGGGGGSPPVVKDCILLNVSCKNWTKCKYNPPPNNPFYEGPEDGIMTRECTWTTNCPGEMKPALKMKCDYIPTCVDGLLNQGEEKVDCGGPCPACPTCEDGIKNGKEEGVDCGGLCPACPTCEDGLLNQGEEKVDCGGPCLPCTSCDDGIQNQGEDGVDCGGPCTPCTEIENPVIFGGRSWLNLLLLAFILVLLGVTGYHYRKSQFVLSSIARVKGLAHIFDPTFDYFAALSKKKREEHARMLNELLSNFVDTVESSGDDFRKLMASPLVKQGISYLNKKKASAFYVLKKENFLFSFSEKPSINLSVSMADIGVVKEILTRLVRIKPEYQTSIRISSYVFKKGGVRKEALDYKEKGNMVIGTDRQLAISITPRTNHESRIIINEIRDLLAQVPHENLVWRYNNIHLYRPGHAEETGLLNNVKMTKKEALMIPSNSKMKGFKETWVEVVNW